MEELEFIDCVSHFDPVEAVMRAEKPRKFISMGQYEDAIACAMAEGFRMGWDAYKKKETEKTNK